MTHHSRLTIGVLIQDILDSRFQEAWLGMVDSLREQDVNLICVPVGSLFRPDLLRDNQRAFLCDLICPDRFDGLVVFQWWEDRQAVKEFYARYAPLPIVTICPMKLDSPTVRADYYQGMRLLIRHVIHEHGLRRIAFLRGPANHAGSNARFCGYQDELAAHGMQVDERLLSPFPDHGTEIARGRMMVRHLLDTMQFQPRRDVEAIVTWHDGIALGALHELHERGIRVPHDMALAGFGGRIETTQSSPPLTTMRIPWNEIGREAALRLVRWLRSGEVPDDLLMTPGLVTRRSCGCLDHEILHIAQCVSEGASQDTSVHGLDRETLIAALDEAESAGWKPNDRWAGDVVDALLADLASSRKAAETREAFLNILEAQCYQVAEHNGQVGAGQIVLTVLYQQLVAQTAKQGEESPGRVPDFQKAAARRENVQRIDRLLHQGRVMVHKLMHWADVRHQAEQETRAGILRWIGQQLIATFNLDDLLDIVVQAMPRLQIPGVYVALYCSPATSFEQACLILASSDSLSYSRSAERDVFPASAFVPVQRLPQDRAWSILVEPLYFGPEQIGLAVFEVGPRDGQVYEILRAELSSAFQGALLVQHVQERSAEIVRQQYILDTFMANVPDAIYFKDREGRILRANQAHATYLGLQSPQDEVGKTDFDFFPDAQAHHKLQQEQQIMRTGEPVLSFEEPRGDHWVLTTKMPLRDEYGTIIGTFGISHDITELKKYRQHLEQLVQDRTAELRNSNILLHREIIEREDAEHSLQISEQQYRLLAEEVIDGIVIVREGVIEFVNAAFAKMFGVSVASLRRKNFVDLFPRHEHAAIRTALLVPESDQSDSPWQTEIMSPSGDSRWLEVSRTTIVWENHPMMLLTMRDITDRKLREQYLESERSRLQQENLTLKTSMTERYKFGHLVGKSAAMQRVYELIISASSSDINVLVVGESGTGKELIARTIHQMSARREQAFVPVNCASIPETLFEREFFGHRKGTFTGADRDKAGLFDRAHGGVLFLDEVTELSPGMQAKLLRVLQDGEYLPLGSTVAKQANTLIVAATNKNPQLLIEQNQLREDFFYRICVIEIHVPPLRQRKDDVPLLLEHFLEYYRHKQEKLKTVPASDLPVNVATLPGEFIQTLYAYDWPGNVRELQNVLQRFLATRRLDDAGPLLKLSGKMRSMPTVDLPASGTSLAETVQAVEKHVIADCLRKNRYHKSKTAAMLGISRVTLNTKMKLYGLHED